MGDKIQDAISYENLRVNGYELERILDMKITSKINEHGTLQLTGVLNSDVKDKYIHSTTEDKKIEIYYEKENEKNTIFYGVVTDIEINCKNKVYQIKIIAKSMTYLMDIKKKSRSFQDINLRTKDLVKSIMDLDYKGSSYILNIPDEEVKELIIQYEETDFEFLKRLSSKYNLGIITTGDYEKIQFVMGVLEESKELKSQSTQYEIYKGITDYEYFKENYLEDAREVDYITYKIQTHEIFKLGSGINFLDRKLYIYDASYEMKDGILENIYNLKMINGIRQKRFFNTRIIGSSIDGKIVSVKNNLINVHLEIDKTHNKEKAYWFKFSTMSAASDGSGWYCMPEIGDSVRLYFPTKDEDQAFGVSTVSGYEVEEGSTKEDKMGNPDNKYLSTKYGKELNLTPEGISISCNGGQADLNLNKDGTLSITSQKNIKITAKENITIKAGKSLFISANESISFKCDKGGGIDFDNQGQVRELGTQVNNN